MPVSFLRWQVMGIEAMASSCAGVGYTGYQEGFLHGQHGQALEGAAQGGGEVPIPGGIYKTWCDAGTW